MAEQRPPSWGGDPSIAWRILLGCVPTPGLDVDELTRRQQALHNVQGWPAPPPVVVGQPGTVERLVAEVRDVPLVLGVANGQLVISAFHAYVDGLGLLDVLAALTAAPVTSSVRGVGDRPRESGGTVDRLREVALAPPASILAPTVSPAEGDSFAAVAVGGRVSTAELVNASATAIVSHNSARGRDSKHVTVAVGAGRPAAAGEPIRNRSELIRIRDVELLGLTDLEQALRSAPLSAAGGSGAGGGLVTRIAVRALAPRLGATLLVSHLGEVTTDAAVGPAFYPVTAGGTGLSLGAVGHNDTTVITLRGRASQWNAGSLRALLASVVDVLK